MKFQIQVSFQILILLDGDKLTVNGDLGRGAPPLCRNVLGDAGEVAGVAESRVDDDEMTLWMVYTCRGFSDKSSIHKPTCNPDGGCGANATQGEMKQLDIPGCGGWAKLDCSGGCINIVKVLKLIFNLIIGIEFC